MAMKTFLLLSLVILYCSEIESSVIKKNSKKKSLDKQESKLTKNTYQGASSNSDLSFKAKYIDPILFDTYTIRGVKYTGPRIFYPALYLKYAPGYIMVSTLVDSTKSFLANSLFKDFFYKMSKETIDSHRNANKNMHNIQVTVLFPVFLFLGLIILVTLASILLAKALEVPKHIDIDLVKSSMKKFDTANDSSRDTDISDLQKYDETESGDCFNYTFSNMMTL